MIYTPMLCKIGEEDDIFKESYLYEPKLDGYRALCYVNKDVHFYTRNKNDITKQFPELAIRQSIKATNCILDGEIVVFNAQGISDFNLLQGRDVLTDQHNIVLRAAAQPAIYVAFDILEKDDLSLLNVPLLERKKILQKTVRDTKRVKKIMYTLDGPILWEFAQKHGLEGVIAKDMESSYYPAKRTNAWLKIKLFQTIDCIVIGYTQGKRTLSALVLGIYHNGTLHYMGKVGTGFDEETQKILHAKLQALKRKTSSVDHTLKDVQWVTPKLVVEIKYAEITKAGRLRQAVFLRLRTDKDARSCTLKSQI